MVLSREQQIEEYGWTSLPCDPAQWGGDKRDNKDPVPQLCDDVSLPDTPLAKAALEYLKNELPRPTFNHSLRVFYYGISLLAEHLRPTLTDDNDRHGNRFAAVPRVEVQP